MGALDYLGAVTPATRAIAAEVVAHLNKIGKPLPVYPDMGSQVIWGYNAGGAEHATGRALDFMVRNSAHVGDVIVAYLWEHRERLGLIHVIWRQRIMSTRTQPGQWRHMADRGSPTENHMDHPHALFDGRAVKPLGKTPTKTSTQTGGSGARTYTKDDVKRFQRVHGLPDDGLWGAMTERQAQAIRRVVKPGMKPRAWDLVRYWRLIYTRPKAERSAVELRRGIQWALKVPSDGIWQSKTDAAWLAIRDQHKMKGV